MLRSFALGFLLLGLALSACTPGGAGSSATAAADSSAPKASPENGYNPDLATVIWDGAGIYASYSPKLDQWQTRLTAGEVVQVLDRTEAEVDGKKTPLLKVKQPDTGKEGWLNANFAIPASKAAAVLEGAEVFSRPALTAEEKKQFQAFDIVAVTAEKDDWVRITGKRSDATWMDADKWIKARALSFERKDLDVAVLVQRAMKAKSKEETLAAIRKILGSADLNGSRFDSALEELMTNLSGVPVDGVMPASADSLGGNRP